ncbi:MAG: hypothetical protein HC827_12720 [Cyanobacteria bacterium RM1_2_2]|nr:hypothetical protein [Cyanobacteria bacterium RM1_2_2]
MTDCPCCPGNMLRHVRSSGVYWFCPNCRQEMPNLTIASVSQLMRSGRSGDAQVKRSALRSSASLSRTAHTL